MVVSSLLGEIDYGMFSHLAHLKVLTTVGLFLIERLYKLIKSAEGVLVGTETG